MPFERMCQVKRKIFIKRWIFLAAALLILLLVFCVQRKTREEIYFTTVNTTGTDAKRFSTTTYAHQVYRYDGGDTYSLVFTLPSNAEYTMTIDGTILYYALSNTRLRSTSSEIHRVDLESGEDELVTYLNCKYVRQISADDTGVYAMGGTEDWHLRIYKLYKSGSINITPDRNISHNFALGGGYVFYVADSDNSGTLMRVDEENLDERAIAEDVFPLSFTAYDNGRVYVSFSQCFSYSEDGGEKKWEGSPGIPVLHDGWLYHCRQEYCQRDGEDSVLNILNAENIKSGKERNYVLSSEIVGFYILSDLISFGSQGFIVDNANCMLGDLQDLNRYYYYPYSGGDGIALTLAE